MLERRRNFGGKLGQISLRRQYSALATHSVNRGRRKENEELRGAAIDHRRPLPH